MFQRIDKNKKICDSIKKEWMYRCTYKESEIVEK